jgi:F-type H+-transporting ATPase subunit b
MPQLDQLPLVALSQFFWLLLVLGLIYFGIGKAMLPKIQSTVDLRDKKIAEDLAAAEAARVEADKVEEAYRERMDASRAEAMKLTSSAKGGAAKAIEKKVAKADAANQAKLDKAHERILLAREAARTEILAVAAEMAQEVAATVAGLRVSKEEALKAVELETVRG